MRVIGQRSGVFSEIANRCFLGGPAASAQGGPPPSGNIVNNLFAAGGVVMLIDSQAPSHVFVSLDAGLTWFTKTSLPDPGSTPGGTLSGKGGVWMTAGQGAYQWRSTDNGATWTQIAPVFNLGSGMVVFGGGSNVGYLSSFAVYGDSANAGVTWPTTGGAPVGTQASSPGGIYDGAQYIYTAFNATSVLPSIYTAPAPAGSVWTPNDVPGGIASPINLVFFDGASYAVAMGGTNTIRVAASIAALVVAADVTIAALADPQWMIKKAGGTWYALGSTGYCTSVTPAVAASWSAKTLYAGGLVAPFAAYDSVHDKIVVAGTNGVQSI